ncbi:hypothetical protein K3727_09550 [Rhodobacteraceae bacterium M382]|nr:hypothetical protein K3727_09550 [Rhodobacteraceae bacterium M382]
MIATKSFLKSKGVMGGAFSIGTLVVGALGYSISPEDVQGAILAAAAIANAVGSIVAIIGRVRATKRIG